MFTDELVPLVMPDIWLEIGLDLGEESAASR